MSFVLLVVSIVISTIGQPFDIVQDLMNLNGLPASLPVEDIAKVLYDAVENWIVSSVLEPIGLIKMICDI